MPEKTLLEEFLIGLLGGAVPSLIVYILTERQTARRLRKQQTCSDIASLIEKVELTEFAASTYYLQPGGTPQSLMEGMHINGQISSITKHISDLRTAHPGSCESLQPSAIAFRKALTDGDFQSADRAAYESENSRFSRMRLASNDLKSALRRTRDTLN